MLGPQSWMQHSRWDLTRAEQTESLPHPAAHTVFDAAQDVLAFWSVSAHCQVMSNSHLAAPPSLNSCFAQPVFVLGIVQTICRTLNLTLKKFILLFRRDDLADLAVEMHSIKFFAGDKAKKG